MHIVMQTWQAYIDNRTAPAGSVHSQTSMEREFLEAPKLKRANARALKPWLYVKNGNGRQRS